MRLIQFIFTVLLFNSGCNQSSPKVVSETKKLDLSKLETHFVSIYTKANSRIIVEDFSLVKIDTVTLRDQYLELCRNVASIRKKLTDSLNKINEEIIYYESLQKSSNPISLAYKKDGDNAKISFSQQRLSMSLSRAEDVASAISYNKRNILPTHKPWERRC